MDKELLFTPRLAEEDFDIDGVGTIRIRALSRAEALKLPDNQSESEAVILSRGIVDPVLTVHEVKRWLEASPAGELQAVSQRIAQLSGMLEDSAKAAYKSDGDGSDAGV